MQVYRQEIADGLADKIQANASIAYTCDVKPVLNQKPTRKILEAIAKSNPNQFDLYYLDAILASVGWNKNDDIFLPGELWNSKATPIDKQFNLMHNQTTSIIGHMTDSWALDYEGNLLDFSVDVVPEEFEIGVSSVIYKHWPTEERQEQINQIIAEIEEGKWFVSMECLFKQFDYGIINSEGLQYTIARNEESSFLTKYLKVFGGEGVYDGYKVGRLLRNFTFSGKGLVDKPANPRSIIFASKASFIGSQANVQIFKGKLPMAENTVDMAAYEKTIAELKQEIIANKAENKALSDRISAEATAKFEKQVADANAKASEAEGKLADAAKALEAKKAELDEAKAKVEKLEKDSKATADELVTLKTQIAAAKRTAKLVDAQVPLELANAIVEKWASATDAQFEDIVALHAKEYAKKDKKKDDDDDDKDAKAGAADNADLDAGKIDEGDDIALASKGKDAKLEVTKALGSWLRGNLKNSNSAKDSE